MNELSFKSMSEIKGGFRWDVENACAVGYYLSTSGAAAGSDELFIAETLFFDANPWCA